MLLVILILQIPAAAETRAGKWFHRGASSVFCATAAIDAFQTVSAAGRTGIVESNSLFRTKQGASVPMVIGVKGLLCAGFLVLGERLPASRMGLFTSMNLVGAGANTYAIMHNRQVIKTAARAKE